MSLIPLEFPPGIYRGGTERQSTGRWRDANLVRWQEGIMRPVKGWEGSLAFPLDGYGAGLYGGGDYGIDQDGTPPKLRSAHAWRTLDGKRYIGLGSFDRLFVAEPETGGLYDITPAGLNPGREDAEIESGYGYGNFGAGPYGVDTPDASTFFPATQWSLDNWGEFLVACSPDDGRLWEWQADPTAAAAVIANAPVDCVGLVVTDERFLFALGAGGNFRNVAWSDREANTVWTPAATNEAGDIDLQTAGQIMLGIKARGQTLILTDVDAHTATYQGPPFVYGFQRVGDDCGAISRRCASAGHRGVFWMSTGGFHFFNGAEVVELRCDVQELVFRDINMNQRSKIWAVNNTENDEVWWFYPSAASNEIDRYASYNWTDDIWMIGALSRTAGVDAGVIERPHYAATDGVIYSHETGFDTDGAEVYAETGPFELGAGDQVMNVTRLIPDERNQGDVTVSFRTRYYPNAPESSHGPYTLTNPTSVRFNGRQTVARVDQAVPGDWRVGSMRIEVRPGGRR